MKRYFYLLLMLLNVTTIWAQKKVAEAAITYNIMINSEGQAPKAADLLDGAKSVVYLKGNYSRTDMISSLGSESTIIDGKTGNAVILKEYGDQRFMIKLTPENLKKTNEKYEGITFSYVEEYKDIAGYKCQKAIGTLKDGSTFNVFFTKELVPVNTNFRAFTKDLPGLALEYEAVMGKRKVVYSAAEVNFNPVGASRFDIPKSNYRVMTYEESQGH